MLGLLQGECHALLDPSNWAAPAASTLQEHLRWESAGVVADVNMVLPLAGFVGSDLLADVIAADLTGGAWPALLVDFGTNSEIALWDGQALWATSAAGGPAFEASGMQCALPGDPGSIFRVRQQDRSLSFEVIGGGQPKGVCGTGLVDWVACLLRAGALSAKGNLVSGDAGRGLSLGDESTGLVLSKRDVDRFQRAKAAIGAGVTVLCERAGVAPAQLQRVVTTGTFGRFLEIANAQAIGLLPPVPVERVETYDNLALSGCERLLLSPESTSALAAVRSRARLLNLAVCPEFEARFVDNLFLAPMGGA
jgi:uncharacterized 2Fe-2S/4Fe-4S cluster protein (DUF4445 family)